MLLQDLAKIITSEEAAVDFLQCHGLLNSGTDNNLCHKCGSPMAIKRRKSRKGENVPVFRCPKKRCQTTRSIRSGNPFFHYTDVNNRINAKLSLCQILELVYLFVMDISFETTKTLTGRNDQTISDWYNMCRGICTEMVSVKRRGQMTGTENDPVQIEEAYFSGRRKYHRGQMLNEDPKAESEDSDAEIENERNHGKKIDGKWVFGLLNSSEARYFFVERRDKNTLLPIILREVMPGSFIHSNKWPAYRQLENLGFNHKTVDHQVNFVDPQTGAHTQKIEQSWLDAEIQILKKKRGVPYLHLQSHLDFFAWKKLHKDEDLFLTFLTDMKDVCRQN